MNEILWVAQEGGHGEATHAGTFTEMMWIVPLLPFVAFLLTAVIGKRLKSGGHVFGIVAVGAGLVLSLIGFVELTSGAEIVEISWNWFSLGERFELEFGIYYDFLCAVMFIVVTAVSLLVHVYSTGYMHGDRRYTWFFAALSLFTGSMLFLVAANNLLQMLVGWEGVGVCSYFLIGHYWEEKEYSSAAIKAFITTRIGDVGFLFGIFALFWMAQTFNIAELNHLSEEGELATGGLTIAALLLFCGAVGKSAQFPLHVWLPDAMAGPTPVSALIHAATMVVAGIYLVARLFMIFEHAGPALDVVAVIASITMLGAAVLALVQDDIKRVLAYSTISQLAYMMAALGVGAFTASIFHLFTHAFFKALLFLGAGSLIHSVGSNNMSDMGGLRSYMPHTFRTFIVGSLALAGIIPFAGFFSKDEILGGALRAGVEGSATAWIVFVAGIITAFLTALYMTRACIKTFWGDYRGKGHPHESPGSMVTPLWILAGLSATVGFLGIPVYGPFADWITVPGEAHHSFSWFYNVLLPGVTLAAAIAAILLGRQVFYFQRWSVDVASGPFAWAYRLVENKYYMDRLYLGAIVRPIQYPIARAANWFNQRVLDGVVDGTARGTLATSNFVYDDVDQQMVDLAVNGAAGLTGATGGLLRYIQSGNVQRYAAVLFVSVASFVGLFVLFGLG